MYTKGLQPNLHKPPWLHWTFVRLGTQHTRPSSLPPLALINHWPYQLLPSSSCVTNSLTLPTSPLLLLHQWFTNLANSSLLPLTSPIHWPRQLFPSSSWVSDSLTLLTPPLLLLCQWFINFNSSFPLFVSLIPNPIDSCVHHWCLSMWHLGTQRPSSSLFLSHWFIDTWPHWPCELIITCDAFWAHQLHEHADLLSSSFDAWTCTYPLHVLAPP